VREWKTAVLGEIIDIKHGFAFPGKNIHNEPPGDILLTPGNFKIGGGFKADKFKYYNGDYPKEYILDEGDLLITMTDLSKFSDTLGYPAIVPNANNIRFLHNQRLGKVLIKQRNKIDSRFLFYLLCTSPYRNEVLASATGTTVKHTSPSRILAYKASLPPLPYQKTIAHILGTLDDKIELNRQMNETLEEIARALFKSWFVDFDPVHRNIARAKNTLDANLNQKYAEHDSLFPDSFVDSELGKIPKGWEVKQVGEVCELNGWTLGKKDTIDELEYIEISKVHQGDIIESEIYQRGKEPSRARRRLRHGDSVLSTVRPDRGSYFLSLNPPAHRIVSTGFVTITPHSIPWSFIYLAVTQERVFQYLGQIADGGAYPAVRPEDIGSLRALVPNSSKILDIFHNMCGGLFQLAEEHRLQSQILANQRDTLLPELLSGQVGVV